MAGTRRGFGIAAAVAPEVVLATAELAEQLGYDSFWVNDTPNGDGLAALAQAATVTQRIKLGVGVIPLSRRTPEQIAEQTRALGLPLDRLMLGVGSGAPDGALARVRAGVRVLKAELDTQVFVAALGPKMSRLSGEEADGVLFNWLTPTHAETSAGWVREAAAAAGRPAPVLATYVRVALGEAAHQRLRRESDRYGGIPAYGAHFRRMGTSGYDASIPANDPAEIASGLRAWDGVLDEIVVRAITANDTVDETLELVRAGAPS